MIQKIELGILMDARVYKQIAVDMGTEACTTYFTNRLIKMDYGLSDAQWMQIYSFPKHTTKTSTIRLICKRKFNIELISTK